MLPRGWPPFVQWAVILIAALLIGVSLLIAAWPTSPATPLVSRKAWVIQGQAFQNVTPQPFEVSDSIRNSPQTVYWRTWSPDTRATMADIRTRPFKPSRFMAIPYGGFAGDPGIQLNLICQQTGQHLTVASARTNTQMTEALVQMPADWCRGDVVLDAHSQSTSEYIEVGTPFRISWLDYYKDSFLGLIGILAVVFIFAWGLVFLPNAISTMWGKEPESIVAGMVCFGLIGYAMFFVYFFSRSAGLVLSAVLFILEAGLLFWLSAYRREALMRAWQRWKSPTVLWGIVVLSAFSLALATHNGAGPWSVNARFTPVRWSTDNQIPMLISEYLFHGQDPRLVDLGPWKVSDRPPLAYGLMATFRLLSWLIASHRDGDSLYYKYQLIAGGVINGLWVVALYYLLSTLRLAHKGIYWVALVVGLTPFAIFNSVYIWPKMLGAAFALFAFIELFEPARNIELVRFVRFGTALLRAAALSALALLSHGGTAFGVIAAILVAVCYRRLPSFNLAMLASLIGLLILMPWGLWQHFIQPPGNALIKYAFSGHFGFGEESKGVFETVRDAYASLTPSSWLDIKLRAIRVFLVGDSSAHKAAEAAAITSFYGGQRVNGFFYLGPSLGALVVGFIPLLFLKPSTATETIHRHAHRLAQIMVGTGSFAVFLYAFFGFHDFWIHMQSYQAILMIVAGLALALYNCEKWYFDMVLKISILYTAWVWCIDPLVTSSNLAYFPAITLCLIAVWIYRYFWFFSDSCGNGRCAAGSLGQTIPAGERSSGKLQTSHFTSTAAAQGGFANCSAPDAEQ